MPAAQLRILLLVFNQEGRGTYWRAHYFGRSLAARGHAVTLLATSPHSRFRLSEQQVEGMRVVLAPDLLPGSLRSGWDLWNTGRRLGWLAGQAFDVVHAFEARPTVLFPALAAQRRGARLVMDWCDWFGRGGSVEERPSRMMRLVLRPIETYFEERFRGRADASTVINRTLLEKLMALGVDRRSILLLRNGTKPDVPVLTQDSAREQLGLPAQGVILGYVGGIYQRDAELMASALEIVRQARPDVRLLLAGYFNRDIESLLTDPAAVIRTGPLPLDALYTHLSACDVCWLPLRDTGANRGRWPLKLSDYMAVGRPVVATDVGDLAEIVTRHELGVVSRDNPADFAAATLALLANPVRREELGLASRRAAREVFNWDRLTDDLEQHYLNVLSGGLG
jgi:glycosyltransferase involved in cell wall biosynthesis